MKLKKKLGVTLNVAGPLCLSNFVAHSYIKLIIKITYSARVYRCNICEFMASDLLKWF